jgi:hypothetical protein
MSDHVDMDSLEEVFSVAKIYSKKSEMWIPALQDKASHDVDALWVASVLYMILDRYVSCIPDNKQIEFSEAVQKILDAMKDGGEEFIYKVDSEGTET